MGGDPIHQIRPGVPFEDLDVIEEIGRGAFSTVYRARDRLIDRTVALKVLDSTPWPDADVARAGILGEARMVARLDDPHVVTLYRVHTLDDDRWVFEMEYLGGGSLDDRLGEDVALEPTEARRYLEAVLHGLAAAHEHDIVHYDIKPANVLLGEHGVAKLADFGLGRITADEDLSTGLLGHRRGTPYYMAPEVVMGRRGTPASDLWSTGVLLYRMLAGRLPFRGLTDATLFYEIQNAAPPPLPETTPPVLASVAMRCLTKIPDDRPASARALLRDLARDVGGAPARVDAVAPPAPTTTLIGREAVLQTVRAHLEDVRAGEGRTVVFLGEAGIGKTAVLHETGTEAQRCGFRRLEARVSVLEGLRRPLAVAMRESLAHDDPSAVSSASDSGEAMLRRLRGEDPDASPDLPLQTPWEIHQALGAMAAPKPIVLLVEDVHLCDAEETRLLAELSTALASSPVYLVMTYRTRDPSGSDSVEDAPSGYYDLIATPDVMRVELGPLGDRSIRTLLERGAGVDSLPLELVERVIRDSEGVPLYAMELFRHLEATGEIERSRDGIRLTERWGKGDLPPRIRDMVTRRLEGLGAEERARLDTAAAAGLEFNGAWLGEVMGEPLLGVLRSLQRLYRERALIVPLERGYRFGHTLYQEAIYADTAPDLRRELHRAWAELLASKTEAEGADPETLGWHWEKAGCPDRAAEPLKQAADAAIGRGEHTRAWHLAERAGLLREGASDEELRAHFGLLVSLDSTFSSEADADRVAALYERLLRAAAALGDETMRLRAVVAENWHRSFRADGPAVDLPALREAADDLPDSRYRGNAFWLLGRCAAAAGEFAEARLALEQAEACFTACGETLQAIEPLHTLGLIHLAEGDLETAQGLLERAAEAHVRMLGKTPQAALSRAMAIITASQAGRPKGAGDALDEPIRWLERCNQGARAAFTTVHQAQLYECEGRIADARAALRRAEPTLREGVLSVALWLLLVRRARLEIAAGDLETAAATITDAGEAAGDLGPVDRAGLVAQEAFLHAARAEPELAKARILGALEVVAPTSEVRDLARLLAETIQLSLLGLDLSDALPTIRALAEGESPRPVPIDLSLRVARVALQRDLTAADADALDRAAAAARDPRIGSHQAVMGAFAELLSARACVLRGERDGAAQRLGEVAHRARRLEHVWLELRALQIARDADLDVDPVRVGALVTLLRERNPANPGLTAQTLVAWTSGMPRA